MADLDSNEGERARRIVIHSTVWSVPIFSAAVATPTVAASSGCASGAIVWSDPGFVRVSSMSGHGTVTATGPSGSALIDYQITSSVQANGALSPDSEHLSPNGQGLKLDSTPQETLAPDVFDPHHSSDTHVSFDAPIQNVRFRIGDVKTMGTPNAIVAKQWVGIRNIVGRQTVSAVAGIGMTYETAPDIYSAHVFGGVNPEDPDREVQFVLVGPITEFSVLFKRQGVAAGGGIHLTNMNFDLDC
ncbi:hypothetical protein [Pseudoclavibacter sp. VKM Ac-2867]|uniref:hypothetical protein n=1 Tax=Pseudoclavibacter sp. VKM Ac-2867 TaxID=2783829 RepID=UPI00188A23DF|nr:hypothetical protein [Pseudoclavibacter sp. VKM Ac-2867]MBF4458091.1 hypothetical protein [Pseudoclavibacter sp. VKM Ac-2867]